MILCFDFATLNIFMFFLHLFIYRVQCVGWTKLNSYNAEDSLFIDLNNRSVYSTRYTGWIFENIVFVNVSHPTDHGGAIYTTNCYYSSHKKVCALNCSTKGSGQYCFVVLYDEVTHSNNVEECTLSKSGNGNGYYPIYLNRGTHDFRQNNISYSHTRESCGCCSSAAYKESEFRYNSIINNKAHTGNCMYFGIQYETKGRTISASNVINITIEYYGQLILNSCIVFRVSGFNFLGNSRDCAIFSESDHVYVIGCYFGDGRSICGNVDIVDTHTSNAYNNLRTNHFWTDLCQFNQLHRSDKLTDSNNEHYALSLIHI